MKFLFWLLVGAGVTVSNLNAQSSDGRLVWLKPHQVVVDSAQYIECLYAVVGEEVARASFLEAEKEGKRRRLKDKITWFIIGTATGIIIKTSAELIR